jgi:formiminotetrahydrofolate cyclodeaminase
MHCTVDSLQNIFLLWLLFVVLQVAAKALETAVFGAYYNVAINLKDITDESFKVTVSYNVAYRSFSLQNDVA